jgi:hypothetical protein
MISGFGIDHGDVVSKKNSDKRHAQGSAIAGAGAVTAGTGLVAGGIPGVKGSYHDVARLKEPGLAGKARAGAKLGGGGVLGYRSAVHEGGVKWFQRVEDKKSKIKNPTPSQTFTRARNQGKIKPELQVLRHMAGAKKVAGAALIGGSAATAYGVHRAKSEVRKDRRRGQAYNATLAGAGATGAAVSTGAGAVLGRQEKKWNNRASHAIDEAGRLIPSMAGRKDPTVTDKQYARQVKRHPGQPFPKSRYPVHSDEAMARDPKKYLHGVSHETAAKAGRLRGDAAQATHFAEVYGDTAKVVRRFRGPSAVVGTVAAGGLLAGRKKKGS